MPPTASDTLDLSIENVSDATWEELVGILTEDELEGAALAACRCSCISCGC
jgi:hypothetical protein